MLEKVEEVMNNSPLVSILMPYYKFGDLLKEAVNSVLGQTRTQIGNC